MKKNTKPVDPEQGRQLQRESLERLLAQLALHQFSPLTEDIDPDRPFLLVGFPSLKDDARFRFRFVQGSLGDLEPWLHAQVTLIDIENAISKR